MKKVIIICMIAIIFAMTTINVDASSSDYELAKEWRNNHYKNATIERVYTRSQGGYKGRVTDTNYIVKYPKKIKKGKKVTIYMVVKNNDIKAMVCCGIVK